MSSTTQTRAITTLPTTLPTEQNSGRYTTESLSTIFSALVSFGDKTTSNYFYKEDNQNTITEISQNSETKPNTGNAERLIATPSAHNTSSFASFFHEHQSVWIFLILALIVMSLLSSNLVKIFRSTKRREIPPNYQMVRQSIISESQVTL